MLRARSLLSTLLLIAALLIGNTGLADAIDQQNDVDAVGLVTVQQIWRSGTVAQTFMVGTTSILSRLELQLSRSPTTVEPLVLELRTVMLDGTPTGDVLATITIPASQVPSAAEIETGTLLQWSLRNHRLQFSAGHPLALVARSGAASPSDSYLWRFEESDFYWPGSAFLQLSPGSFSTYFGDLGFRSYAEVSVTQFLRGTLSYTDADFSASERLEATFTVRSDALASQGPSGEWNYVWLDAPWQGEAGTRPDQVSGVVSTLQITNDDLTSATPDRWALDLITQEPRPLLPSGRSVSYLRIFAFDIGSDLLQSTSLPLLAPNLALADIKTGFINFTNGEFLSLVLDELRTAGPDTDGDGSTDVDDNCPFASNASQGNVDVDDAGDECDTCLDDRVSDPDRDLVCGAADNCPSVANVLQMDSDLDLVGDACDGCPSDPSNDEDGDSRCGSVDNCPSDANPGQQDQDQDGLGDACDPDSDGDGVINLVDTCPALANPSSAQQDSDVDGVGDLCDACPLSILNDPDGDGACAGADNCPTLANPDQQDTDVDGEGDACDTDVDGDEFENAADNCPTIANPSQTNSDGDLLGDDCDQNAAAQETTVFAGNFGQISQAPTLRWRFVANDPHLGVGSTATLATGQCVVASIDYFGSTTEVHFGFLRYVPSGFACCAWAGDCPSNGSCSYSEDHCVAQGNTTYCSTSFAWGARANEAEGHSDADSHPDQCDNCPLVTNDDQADADGDGYGDACECGDVDGNGVVQAPDASRIRFALAGLVPLSNALKCNVRDPVNQNDADQNGLRDDCNVLDSVIVRRASASPALSELERVCVPAGGS